MLTHHEVQVETATTCRRLVLEAIFGERKEFSEINLKTLAASESFLGQHRWLLGVVVDVHVHQLLLGGLLSHHHFYSKKGSMRNDFIITK